MPWSFSSQLLNFSHMYWDANRYKVNIGREKKRKFPQVSHQLRQVCSLLQTLQPSLLPTLQRLLSPTFLLFLVNSPLQQVFRNVWASLQIIHNSKNCEIWHLVCCKRTHNFSNGIDSISSLKRCYKSWCCSFWWRPPARWQLGSFITVKGGDDLCSHPDIIIFMHYVFKILSFPDADGWSWQQFGQLS